jgi:hypothetical protein
MRRGVGPAKLNVGMMECWSKGVKEDWKNENSTPFICNFRQKPSRFFEV